VEALFKADSVLMDEFNHKLGNGKWNHFMDQVHIGYTIWQDPPQNIAPKVTRLQLPEPAALGVAVEGSTSAWPGAPEEPVLPRFDRHGMRHYIDLFNRGQSPFEFSASSSSPWIVLSEKRGRVAKDVRMWVSIDWDKAPKVSSSGSISITRDRRESIKIRVETLNSGPVYLSDGFIEGDGFVSMEAGHYTRSVRAGRIRWEKIDDYGKTLSAMSVMPVAAGSVLPPKDSPRLEYSMYLRSPGEVVVSSIVAPSLNFVPGRGLRYAVSFDDQQPQIVEIVPEGFDARNGNREWEESVKNNSRTVRSSHKLTKVGYHMLKIWMVDPGVVLQKIIVNTGGLKPSYLGPPESVRFKVTTMTNGK
jgi:hypothetical protein